MNIRASWTGAIAVVILAGFGLVGVRATSGDLSNTGMADPAALVSAFDRFAGSAPPPNIVQLSVSNLRGVSNEAVNAGGLVAVNLTTGAVASFVRLLPADATFDLWLIDNQPGSGHTTLAEHGDLLMKVGMYAKVSGRDVLNAAMGTAAFAGFFPDRAFVVRSGESPVDGFALTGPGTLFARLGQHQVRFVEDASAALGFDPTAAATRVADFARIIAEGRELFLEETFDGNGRTCGTCHVEANNFTVDPRLIAKLPPTDPLFVAETNPALATLENSDLLRRFGLILVNADGFDPSRGFVFRGAQNVQALANSTTPQSPKLWHRLQYQWPQPQPARTTRLGQRCPAAPRLRSRCDRATCANDTEPHVRSRLPCAYRRRIGRDGRISALARPSGGLQPSDAGTEEHIGNQRKDPLFDERESVRASAA